MAPITIKLDDETLRGLDELAHGSTRSDVVRKAVVQYIAKAKLEKRRQEVQVYARDEAVRSEMSRMAEADIDESIAVLARLERENAD